MKTPKSQSLKQLRAGAQTGQAIVLIALLILVLFGMLGLAIDSGRAYVDRRDQQAAVDAAALAAGDWYENYANLYGSTLPQSKQVYEHNLHFYSGPTSDSDTTTFVGVNNNLQQDTDVMTFPGGYSLTIVATNTQFNGYQFDFTSVHQLPLAFMQIFGGSPTVTISATATSIVGNQRQTPALLTLSTGSCALNLKGSATLTLLGDAYSNGTACVDANLQEAGNCYGAAGSTCGSATYYCYNSTPGFVPYPPPCKSGDTQGQPVVPAPTLPDPGYLASSVPYYSTPQAEAAGNRGTWTEMYPGVYGTFHLSGCGGANAAGCCVFLDAGVYDWTNGYTSDATGSLVSNELKAPDEELYSAPGTTNLAGIQFWNQNGVNCAGNFSLAVNIVSGYGIKHNGINAANTWGVELTSVRWDTFIDPTITPNPCFSSPGCRRESAPSECQQVVTDDTKDQVIDVSITENAPGAQYYNVYVNPYGCNGNPNQFAFIDRFLAPGYVDGGSAPASPVGPFPNGTGVTLSNGKGGYICSAAGHSICAITASQLSPTGLCYAQVRSANCQTPDDELAPQCFSSCPPPPGLLSQENAAMSLEYPPYTGGDVANENYCVVSPNPGDPSAPCATSKVTPGAVQFYLPAGSCVSQQAQGATYVFAGLQYNWIVIYSPASNTCANVMNGGSATQYIGTIYTPGANWTINGGNRSPLAGQVICYTASVSGAGAVGIDFNPNYSPAPPAARLIN
ncbi:MAG TPA: pilus assembly protein TadG-related protein [Candidatus Dormibacteraeota bacterium]|nr:pilus assembly protein TadG-related protein [Candidatus Dormibacteraeota bacterium]